MAKKNKSGLMIPFTYHFEEMIDYCGYTYVEGTTNSHDIVWDTIECNAVANYPIRHNWMSDEVFSEMMNAHKKLLENDRYIEATHIVWKENYEFEDTMVVKGMSRGRSAANFKFTSKSNGKEFNIFMKDIVDMLKQCSFINGEITGKWTFVKRGSNYGLSMVFE